MMEAGRELDALVAENVMGLEARWDTETRCPYCGLEMRYCGSRSWCSECREWRYGPYKDYSTDIAAAWEVVERVCNWDEDDNMLTLTGQGDPDPGEAWWKADISGTLCEHFIGGAATVPHAICLAALVAKGIGLESRGEE